MFLIKQELHNLNVRTISYIQIAYNEMFFYKAMSNIYFYNSFCNFYKDIFEINIAF